MGESFQRLGRRPRLRIPDHRFHHRPGAPTRHGQKGGPEDRAIGRSRGGLTTKLHAAVDALGNPIRFIVTPGERNDITQAHALIDGLPAVHVLADTAYDADHFRDAIAAAKAQAVIPFSRSRSAVSNHDRHVYKERNLVERFFNKLKHFRRIATRYEQTARAFLSMVQLVAVVIWTR
jgi:transposase